jgi:CheY-like chemotaxis protein
MAPLEATARKKGLALWHRLEPSAPLRMVGDRCRLRQVLLNLAGNGVKFTETGSVGIIAEAVDFADGPGEPGGAAPGTPSGVPPGSPSGAASGAGAELSGTPPRPVLPGGLHRIHFRVSDTGIGIPVEKQALIFEAFRQADGSTTRRYGGTGLGLSISRHLVSLMGGRIWLQSQPGAGSTFHFTITAESAGSAARAARPAAPPAESEVPSPAGRHVLLVEDNPVNQKLARRVLENAGCTVVCAMDGRAAVDACAAERFDVVLMDLQMPHMDGFEATAELRRREAISGGHLPIVALTANAMKGDRELCLAAGMDGYVTKPMKRPELFRAIASGFETYETALR